MKSPLRGTVEVVENTQYHLLKGKDHCALHDNPNNSEKPDTGAMLVQPSCTRESVLAPYLGYDEAHRKAAQRDVDREDQIHE